MTYDGGHAADWGEKLVNLMTGPAQCQEDDEVW